MRKLRFVRPVALGIALATALSSFSAPLGAQVMFFDSARPITFEEEISRYLPGVASYRKGLELYANGQKSAAVDAWQQAAAWAMKDAQYSLGLAYFRGEGVTVDRPRGLAWLALSAERKSPRLQAALATAWDEASEPEHQQANALWRELRRDYGDEAVLAKAKKRYETEIAQLNSRTGKGGAKMVSRTLGPIEVSAYREKLDALAVQNFGSASANDSTTAATAPPKEAG